MQKVRIHDQGVEMGQGGEVHQSTENDRFETLTSQQGIPISDNQNTLKVGEKGPVLIEDFHFREKIFHFDHERIPERVVHARGYGARGYFETQESLSDVTSADLFQRKGEQTPVFVRFSTVIGSKGSFDLARDVRGFATKFYTKQGNWDLVGNNIPVFFIQDPLKFPDIIHAAKPEPDRDFPQAQTAHDNFWDSISLTPESMHMIMWIMSDRAIPRSYRFMEGFGVHTFRFVNSEGKSTLVKFIWKPKFGLQSVTWDEALQINGADPDFHRHDLWHAILSGIFPEYDLCVQLFDEAFANAFEFDVLDSTKFIPEEQVPVKVIGRLVLNEVVDNFFLETEQVAFCTQNVVPGIAFTDDPLLQGRNFSYLDTQLKRLGSPNFTQIPVNAARCPVSLFQQDGQMAMRNPHGRVNYEPNSWSQGPRENPSLGYKFYPLQVEGEKRKLRSSSFRDHYSQARQFYISQTEIEQEHVIDALSFELGKVIQPVIRERMISHLLNIDKEMAEQVATNLGLKELPKPAEAAESTRQDLKVSDALSIIKNGPKEFRGRSIGLVIEGGTDSSVYQDLQSEAQKLECTIFNIGLHGGTVRLDDRSEVMIHGHIKGGQAFLFDTVVLALPRDLQKLARNYEVSKFLITAFHNNKFIGFSAGNAELLRGLGVQPDDGCFELDGSNADKFLSLCADLRFWKRRSMQQQE
jgi:catalase